MELFVSNQAATHLRSASRWARFLAALGFLNVLLLFSASVALFTVGTALFQSDQLTQLNIPPEAKTQLGFDPSAYDLTSLSYMPMLLGVLYIIFGIVYLFPIISLFSFGSHASSAVKRTDSQKLEQALKNLAAHYRFLGWFVILTLIAYLLIGVAMLSYGLFAGFSSLG